jgi:CRP/FNR family nitrogen fixation transcriptional regulator
MSERLAAIDAIELPMSRQDIADYLGLTIETVSRTMSQLVSDHAIGVPNSRRIRAAQLRRSAQTEFVKAFVALTTPTLIACRLRQPR